MKYGILYQKIWNFMSKYDILIIKEQKIYKCLVYKRKDQTNDR